MLLAAVLPLWCVLKTWNRTKKILETKVNKFVLLNHFPPFQLNRDSLRFLVYTVVGLLSQVFLLPFFRIWRRPSSLSLSLSFRPSPSFRLPSLFIICPAATVHGHDIHWQCNWYGHTTSWSTLLTSKFSRAQMINVAVSIKIYDSLQWPAFTLGLATWKKKITRWFCEHWTKCVARQTSHIGRICFITKFLCR